MLPWCQGWPFRSYHKPCQCPLLSSFPLTALWVKYSKVSPPHCLPLTRTHLCHGMPATIAIDNSSLIWSHWNPGDSKAVHPAFPPRSFQSQEPDPKLPEPRGILFNQLKEVGKAPMVLLPPPCCKDCHFAGTNYLLPSRKLNNNQGLWFLLRNWGPELSIINTSNIVLTQGK